MGCLPRKTGAFVCFAFIFKEKERLFRRIFISLHSEIKHDKLMQPLNLPPFESNIKTLNGMVKIMDVLRRRFVALTPEEWVRQHFVHFMVEYKGYSPTLMANEVAVTLNGMSRRCDTVVYQQEGLRPLMIVEYKAPHVEITQKVFDQICRYNMVLEVDFLVVSNGLRHYCCQVDAKNGSYAFLEDIPDYDTLKSLSGR